MPDARETAGLLAGRAPELARELLPGGHRAGAEWRAGGLDGAKGKSLGVHLFGPKAGVWADFASGESGDALDLVRLTRCGGDMKAALDWAASWLGLPREARQAPAPAPPPPRRAAAETEPERDPDAEARQAKAKALFLVAEPRLAGTPADLYLQARGIHLAQLGRQPRALRFHPGLWNGESRRAWPALVAAVTDSGGGLCALHRTWLAQDAAGVWRKAPLEVAKASLGRVAGGTIRLWRGASGRNLSAARPGETVVLAEGIETGLSVAVACPELRVLATVSLGNMGKVELPPVISTVIIAADNDPPDSPADKALHAAAERFAAQSRTVKIARSPLGAKTDMNDLLVAE
jgi:phage/plasmid primase-like uncharacterized protein